MGGFLLRHDMGEEPGSEKPDNGDGNSDELEEVEHALQLKTDKVETAGAVGLRAEGIE